MLKVAIIGCGNIYSIHADAIKKSKKADLVAVVDINVGKVKKAAELYQCKAYTNYKELSDINIDVVHICTPHYLHSSMAIEMMEAGYDVLVEKPIALNIEQVNDMIKISKKTRKRFGVVFQNRFSNNIMHAKEFVEKGKFGKILGLKGIVTWHRDEEYYENSRWRGFYNTEGGGVLINQAIHTLDLLQWFGGNVSAVKGNVDTRVLGSVIEVEDTADATIYFENSAIGLFYATNCYSSNSPVEVELNFEKGNIKMTGDRIIINDNENILNNRKKNDSNYKTYWGCGHKKLIEGFYSDIIKNENNYIINGEEGIKSIKLIKGINCSSKTGKKYFY